MTRNLHTLANMAVIVPYIAEIDWYIFAPNSTVDRVFVHM